MKTQQQYDNIFDNLKLSSKFKKDINEYNLEDVIQLIDIGINESDDDFIFKVIKNYNDFSDKLKNLFMRIIHRRPYVKYVNLFLKHTDIDFSDGNYIIPRKIATYGYLNIFKRLMKEKNLVNEESLELYFSESCMEQYHIVKYLIDEFEFEINAKYNIFFAKKASKKRPKKPSAQKIQPVIRRAYGPGRGATEKQQGHRGGWPIGQSRANQLWGVQIHAIAGLPDNPGQSHD